jgi:hypothetical protein
MWKNSNTVLKVTVATKGGKPDILRGRIFSADEPNFLIGFALMDRSLKTFDVSNADFRVGNRIVEAERGEDGEDFLVFEAT